MNRRGLTLLEVLAAAALLAVMAGACVPLLSDAARLASLDGTSSQMASQQFTGLQLGSVAEDTDRLASALNKLVDEERNAIGEGVLLLDELSGGSVEVVQIQQTESGSWLMCTWRSGRVLIWQPVVDSEDQP